MIRESFCRLDICKLYHTCCTSDKYVV